MNLPEIVEQIAEAQLRTQNTLAQLAEAEVRTQQSITEVSEAVVRYVDGANARMAMMEKNLDNLIRIITAEHTNGKGQR
jgi:hypothetical protein